MFSNFKVMERMSSVTNTRLQSKEQHGPTVVARMILHVILHAVKVKKLVVTMPVKRIGAT